MVSLTACFDHIATCNQYDAADHVPLRIAGRVMGRLRRANARLLAAMPEFTVAGTGIALAPACDSTPDARSDAIDRILDRLAAAGEPVRRRRERFPLIRSWGEEPLATLDRGIVSWLGIRNFGVHMNVTTRREGETLMWLGRRSRLKPVAPGQLDNLVAGGQPHGLSLAANIAKEAEEEAGIPASLMQAAKPVGVTSYVMAGESGCRDHVLFLYDLEVPADFVPVSQDDEHEAFLCVSPRQVWDWLQTPDAFKFNVNLVLIDWFLRQGHIPCDTPGYLELVSALRTEPPLPAF
jgi:8-oxo-dGTP pyrophosphatase MutT (NUDIX family)